jgi:hypothetical protein
MQLRITHCTASTLHAPPTTVRTRGSPVRLHSPRKTAKRPQVCPDTIVSSIKICVELFAHARAVMKLTCPTTFTKENCQAPPGILYYSAICMYQNICTCTCIVLSTCTCSAASCCSCVHLAKFCNVECFQTRSSPARLHSTRITAKRLQVCADTIVCMYHSSPVMHVLPRSNLQKSDRLKSQWRVSYERF